MQQVFLIPSRLKKTWKISTYPFPSSFALDSLTCKASFPQLQHLSSPDATKLLTTSCQGISCEMQVDWSSTTGRPARHSLWSCPPRLPGGRRSERWGGALHLAGWDSPRHCPRSETEKNYTHTATLALMWKALMQVKFEQSEWLYKTICMEIKLYNWGDLHV